MHCVCICVYTRTSVCMHTGACLHMAGGLSPMVCPSLLPSMLPREIFALSEDGICWCMMTSFPIIPTPIHVYGIMALGPYPGRRMASGGRARFWCGWAWSRRRRTVWPLTGSAKSCPRAQPACVQPRWQLCCGVSRRIRARSGCAPPSVWMALSTRSTRSESAFRLRLLSCQSLGGGNP